MKKAEQDRSLKLKLLKNHQEIFKQNNIDFSDYHIKLTEIEGYPLYFEVKPRTQVQKMPQTDHTSQSEHQKFMDQHFMDCHNV